MFTPDPKKAIEPVTLYGGASLLLNFKLLSPGQKFESTNRVIRESISLPTAIRWRAMGGDVMVAFNYDPELGPPTKHFLAEEGEFEVKNGIETVSFSPQRPGQKVTLYFEIR